jgi:pimeloyl-ACP methyl ester carboxylesterase/mannose-6-phosphate isomerase-like protein (cupin superfamily)
MAEISITGPHEGEVALSGPVQMRILEDGSTTSHRLGLGEITIAPHTDGPPQHRHARHDEGFYVVSGTARFTVGDTSYDAPAGTLVMVPPGAPHTFGNATGEPAVLLNTFTPDLYVQYFRDLRDMIAAGQPMTPAEVVGVMARYATFPATGYASPVTATRTITADGIGAVPVSYTDRGAGPVFLLLHGGAGPQSVAGFADLLADTGPARVIVPVHPGFGGTPRPDGLSSIEDLARLYIALLDELGLDGVTVIGNSIGGWIAADMAVAGSARLAGLVLVDAVGIEVPGHPVADFFSLTLDQVFQLSFHDPAPFRIDPATLPPAAQAAAAGNRAALAVYAGTSMTDPSLAGRLAAMQTPALVLWGDSDQIVDPDYGRAFAAAIPGARFELLTGTGHMPQVETPDQALQAIWDWAARTRL